ncbi:hypothetical protein [Streptomonospora salina]|uniref:hypothetical protein n=1 Tax=Streptomonospora salina TaxID=104205 RepID=UPI0035E50EFD
MGKRWTLRRPAPGAWRGIGTDAALWGGCVALIAQETHGVRAAPVAETAAVAVLLAAAFVLRRRRPFAALRPPTSADLVATVRETGFP